jgi:hypothetical protein
MRERADGPAARTGITNLISALSLDHFFEICCGHSAGNLLKSLRNLFYFPKKTK